jgi:hypothetical protein
MNREKERPSPQRQALFDLFEKRKNEAMDILNHQKASYGWGGGPDASCRQPQGPHKTKRTNKPKRVANELRKKNPALALPYLRRWVSFRPYPNSSAEN